MNKPRVRWPFAILAYVFAALGLLGLAVPGLPTTPFILLAAWAASRGSERMHVWLRDHPRLGPPLRDWREEGAISTRAKILAVVLLAMSWTILLVRGTATWLLIALAAFFMGLAVFVGTRPRPGA
jgi:uncharacterized membrane protein YbaN (DUF454 family)